MVLSTDFQFSQGSLQDYVDCPRRFQLRYLLRLAWPAVEAEPALENERHLQQGAAFHRLAHQHVLGLSPERLSSMATDRDLSRWWHNYLNSAPADVSGPRYPEVVLSAPVRGHRLVAKYDLIALIRGLGRRPSPNKRPSPNERASLIERASPIEKAVILDWKTSRKRPRRRWLAERLQTKVYPYLLVLAGSHLNEDKPFQAEQVEMIYWFANFPEDPEHFSYDADQYDEDSDYLASLIEEIKSLGDDDFPLTTQERRCRYCPYRSLCQRGVRAGPFDEAEGEPEDDSDLGMALDFEQIAEIEY